MQAIAVGQSIDSSEYAAFVEAPNGAAQDDEEVSSRAEHNNADKENSGSDLILAQQAAEVGAQEAANAIESDTDDSNKPQVEEAVIKIQALVRGHLTRKALKDAQQQQAVAHNALGQSQFDAANLIGNRK